MLQIALAYIALTTVLFMFPPELPVTGSSMSKYPVTAYKLLQKLILYIDYCVAAFGIIVIVSTIQWIVDGRKNFTGPRVDTEVLAAVGGAPSIDEGTTEHREDK